MRYFLACPLSNRLSPWKYSMSCDALVHGTGRSVGSLLNNNGTVLATLGCPKPIASYSIEHISAETIQSYYTPHLIDIRYDQPLLSIVHTAKRENEHTYTVRLGINREDVFQKKPPFGAIVTLIVDQNQGVHIGDIISTIIPYDESVYRAQLITLSEKIGTHGVFEPMSSYLGREQEGILAYDRSDDIRSFADPSVVLYNIGNGGMMDNTVVYHATLHTSSIDINSPFAQVELKYDRAEDVLEICSLVIESNFFGGSKKNIKISEEYLLMFRGIFQLEAAIGFTNDTKIFFERDSAHDTKNTPQGNMAYYRKLVDRHARKENPQSTSATCSLIQAMKEDPRLFTLH